MTRTSGVVLVVVIIIAGAVTTYLIGKKRATKKGYANNDFTSAIYGLPKGKPSTKPAKGATGYMSL